LTNRQSAKATPLLLRCRTMARLCRSQPVLPEAPPPSAPLKASQSFAKVLANSAFTLHQEHVQASIGAICASPTWHHVICNLVAERLAEGRRSSAVETQGKEMRSGGLSRSGAPQEAVSSDDAAHSRQLRLWPPVCSVKLCGHVFATWLRRAPQWRRVAADTR
jgi:hypothetical protein